MYSNIKQQILTKLSLHKSLRYSEIKPKETENDLFNYHLQHLVRIGLVQKENGRYSLSETGIKYVHSEQMLGIFHPVPDVFKLTVLMILFDPAKSAVLAQKRGRKPHYGSWGIIGGVVHHGESIVKAASRVFSDETGLSAKFRIIGIIRNVKIYKNELFSDSIFYICASDSFTGQLKTETEHGVHRWIPITRAIANEENSPQRMSGLVDILNAIKDENSILIEFTHRDERTKLVSI